MQRESDHQELLYMKPRQTSDLACLLLTSAVGYICNLKLPLLLAAAISCILLILISRLRHRLKSPTRWWTGIGLCSGSFLGTAASMMDEMQQGSAAALVHSPQERLALVVLLGITGVLAGRRVGIDPNAVRGRSIGDLLKSLSGTFTGLFGVLVSIAFVLNGLEEARTLSSRLTTSLTIMIRALIGPGWIRRMLVVYQRNHRH